MQPLVVLDGGHNPDAATALVEALEESLRWKRLHLVIAMFEDKAVDEVAAILAPISDEAYAARNDSTRSAPPSRVDEALRSAGAGQVREYADVRAAAEAALAAADDYDLILVTGSFYTVGDARPLFF